MRYFGLYLHFFFVNSLIFKLYFYNTDYWLAQYSLLDRPGRSCFCWCSANSQLHAGLFHFTVPQFVNKDIKLPSFTKCLNL